MSRVRVKKVARVRCLEDGPRALKSSHLVVLSFGNNHLAPICAGLLPLLVCQAVEFDPKVLDTHDLQGSQLAVAQSGLVGVLSHPLSLTHI